MLVTTPKFDVNASVTIDSRETSLEQSIQRFWEHFLYVSELLLLEENEIKRDGKLFIRTNLEMGCLS